MKKISVVITSIMITTAIALSSASIFALTKKNEASEIATATEAKYLKLDGKAMRPHRKLVRRLELTEEQKVQVKLINEIHKEESAANRENITDFQAQMRSLLVAPTFDEASFVDLHNQYQTTFSQIALLKAKHRHAFMQVLDSDQQEKLLLIQSKVKPLF